MNEIHRGLLLEHGFFVVVQRLRLRPLRLAAARSPSAYLSVPAAVLPGRPETQCGLAGWHRQGPLPRTAIAAAGGCDRAQQSRFLLVLLVSYAASSQFCACVYSPTNTSCATPLDLSGTVRPRSKARESSRSRKRERRSTQAHCGCSR